MRRTSRAWVRPLAAVGLLAVLVWRVGASPFLDGLHRVSVPALVTAVVLAVLTTACCAWRWTLVARGLGVHVPFGAAIAAYYRSQFLNMTLPGGVVGDVHRAVRHGLDTGDVGRGLRVVAWERTAGQVVQAALTVAVLLVLPSPARGWMPVVLAAAVAGVVVARVIYRLAGRARPHPLLRKAERVLLTGVADIRYGLLARRAWPGIALASAVVVAGHTATFVVAARTAGSDASVVQLVPLALLVLLAMGLPTSIGGWGPREGAAAVVFGAAGLSATLGVATAVVYGVMAFVACLPGAVLLATAWFRVDARASWPSPIAVAVPQGVPHA
jgi:uncharacterized membrane protein YbhN (UPF0104 family)